MSFSRLTASLLALIVAVLVIVMVNSARDARLHAVIASGDEVIAFDRNSPTGYSGGLRQFLAANHDDESYQWIVQTQLGLRTGGRVRAIAYDNAPFGRTVLTPSPYRWWLALVSRVRDVFSTAPSAANVEAAALFADPALELLALFVVGLLAFRWFGPEAAVVAIIGIAFSYPLGAVFLGGEPGDAGLGALAFLLAMLALARAVIFSASPPTKVRSSANTMFAVAGVLAAGTLWINAAYGVLLALSTFAAVLAHAFAQRRSSATTGAPYPPGTWRVWSTAAAAGTLIASLVEYFPTYLDGWHLEFIHPAYGFAWLGLGGVLSWACTAIHTGRINLGWRAWLRLALSVFALGAVIVVGVRYGGFATLAASLVLLPTHLHGASGSQSMASWLSNQGVAASLLGAGFPLAIMTAAAIRLARRAAPPVGIILALTCALISFGAAIADIAWWSVANAATITLAVVLVRPTLSGRPLSRWIWGSAAVAAIGLGGFLLRVEAGTTTGALTEADVVALVERDLSHWLARRTGGTGAVVLAPPSLSSSLYFHGSLRTLGTPYWENKDGMQAAVRLAAASSPDEGLALAGRREVRFIALPSWDDTLDRLVRLTSNAPQKSLLGLLHAWQAPRWLRPLPYPIPNIPGFEGRTIAVFQVVDVQENAVALSRLAECFAEMGKLDDAAKVAGTIEHAFPADLGGRVARASVASAFGDADRLKADLAVLTTPESLAEAPKLPWDRQVSYAIALAQGQRLDLARRLVQQCVSDMDEAKLRFLTPQSLYRFELLCKIGQVEISDQKLRALARELLPPELRDRV